MPISRSPRQLSSVSDAQAELEAAPTTLVSVALLVVAAVGRKSVAARGIGAIVISAVRPLAMDATVR